MSKSNKSQIDLQNEFELYSINKRHGKFKQELQRMRLQQNCKKQTLLNLRMSSSQSQLSNQNQQQQQQARMFQLQQQHNNKMAQERINKQNRKVRNLHKLHSLLTTTVKSKRVPHMNLRQIRNQNKETEESDDENDNDDSSNDNDDDSEFVDSDSDSDELGSSDYSSKKKQFQLSGDMNMMLYLMENNMIFEEDMGQLNQHLTNKFNMGVKGTLLLMKQLTDSISMQYTLEMDYSLTNSLLTTSNQLFVAYHSTPLNAELNYTIAIDSEKRHVTYVEQQIGIRKVYLNYHIDCTFSLHKMSDEEQFRTGYFLSLKKAITKNVTLFTNYDSRRNQCVIGAVYKF